jgi:predicted RNA-binding Zn ribbon-like protein
MGKRCWRGSAGTGSATPGVCRPCRRLGRPMPKAERWPMKPRSPYARRVNGVLARVLSGARLAWGAGELTWSIGREFDPLDLLKPIVVSAAELMTGPRAGRVKQCQDDRGCGWLFVDESRAQNRRWCSMGDCGNRAKANRHYERVRGERT